MKKEFYFFVFLVLMTSKIHAQNWQVSDLSADGIGAKVAFPASPTKTVAQKWECN